MFFKLFHLNLEKSPFFQLFQLFQPFQPKWQPCGPYKGCLGLLIRKALIPKKLCTAFATIPAFAVDMSPTNCSFFVSCKNNGFSFNTVPTISPLGTRYIGHSSRKCTSSSTLPGQKGQKRCSFGVLGVVCLPFSMFKVLLESLNLVNDCLIAILLISWRYFSHPTCVLKSA